jgi:hypothetical protein
MLFRRYLPRFFVASMASASQAIGGFFYSATLFRRYCHAFSSLLATLFRRKYGICVASHWWVFLLCHAFSSLLPQFFVSTCHTFSSQVWHLRRKPLVGFLLWHAFSSLLPRFFVAIATLFCHKKVYLSLG